MKNATPYRLLIDGELVEGDRGIDVIDPATAEPFATSPCASADQLHRAVEAANRAFPGWAATAIGDRQRLVGDLADRIEANLDRIATLLVREQGKPMPLAQMEVRGAAAILRIFAAMTPEDRLLRDNENVRIIETRAPLGAVAAITPWNFPVSLLALKLAPALVAGNSLVVKPAPTTPLTTCLLGELCVDIFPRGVINIIVDNNDLGGQLTGHPDIAKISFTGSTATGRKIMASAASTIKRITLELGGNDAAIILDDVDPKEIAPKIFFSAMANAGQICIAIKRVYVPAALHDEICSELARLADAAVVGSGLEAGVEVGPVQNRAQFDRVMDLIASAQTEGNVIAGGRAENGPGYFIRPTIVRDLSDDARIVREEQFGPILPVLRYDDIEDAIARANASEFGLGASVWSNDGERALAVAKRLEAGTVWINKHLDLSFDLPFRGAKQSGLGTEGGIEGLEEFTQAKVINMTVGRN